MDPKQQYGTRFQGVGTATAATAVVAISLPTGGIDNWVSDIAASSDVGTAEVQIIDGALGSGSVIWHTTICASSAGGPFVVSFKQPLRCGGTATAYITGASTSLKAVNIAGYAT